MFHTNLTLIMAYDLMFPVVFIISLVYFSYLAVNFAADKGWILKDDIQDSTYNNENNGDDNNACGSPAKRVS